MSAIKDMIKVTEPPRTLNKYDSGEAKIYGLDRIGIWSWKKNAYTGCIDTPGCEFTFENPLKPYFAPMTGTEPMPLALSREAKRYGSDDLPAFLR